MFLTKMIKHWPLSSNLQEKVLPLWLPPMIASPPPLPQCYSAEPSCNMMRPRPHEPSRNIMRLRLPEPPCNIKSQWRSKHHGLLIAAEIRNKSNAEHIRDERFSPSVSSSFKFNVTYLHRFVCMVWEGCCFFVLFCLSYTKQMICCWENEKFIHTNTVCSNFPSKWRV